jgi:hypothetical protein
MWWHKKPLQVWDAHLNNEYEVAERFAEYLGLIVPEELACPYCKERLNSKIEVLDDYFNVLCHECGTRYNPEDYREPAPWEKLQSPFPKPQPTPANMDRAGDGGPAYARATMRRTMTQYEHMVEAIHSLLDLHLFLVEDKKLTKSAVNVYISWLKGNMDAETCAAALQASLNKDTRQRMARRTGVSL